MDKHEVERKISEAASLLASGKPEMAELWMTRLLAEDFDMSDLDRVILKAQANDLMGRAQFALRRFKEAIETLQGNSQDLQNWLSSRQFDSRNDDQRRIGHLLAASLENLCFAQMELNKPKEAEIAGKEAIAVAEQYGGPNSLLLAQALFGVSLVWYRQKDLATAEDMLLRAQKIFAEKQDLKMSAFCFNNLGRLYEEQGNTAKGVEFHKKAVEIRRGLPDRLDLAFSLGNLGAALASDSQWQEAKNALTEAIAIYKEHGRTASPEYAGFKNNLEICEKALKESSSQ